MKQLITAFFLVAFSLSLFCQGNTGIRGGLNLSSNFDYGEGPAMGWHLAGYKDFETYKKLSFRAELKVQRIGSKMSNNRVVSEFFTSIPLLLDFGHELSDFNSFYLGVEPGLFVGGHETKGEQLNPIHYFSTKKNRYVRPYDGDVFNIDGVMGFRVGNRINTYLFLNFGLINPNIYLSLSIGM